MLPSNFTGDGSWDTNRLEALIKNVPGAIYRCSPESDWAMGFISDEIEAISGYPAAEFVGSSVRTFASVIHPEDRAMVEERVGEALERRDSFVLEYRLVHADGSVRWVHERGRGIFDAAGEVQFLDGAIFDITARREAEDRLAYLAYHDALTDLPNRALFQEHLAATIATADRSGAPAAVLFADLDDFKLINDNFGHSVGDQLLIDVAARLRRVTRAGDIVARQGGDEFLILVTGPSVARESAVEARAAIRTAVGRIASKLRDALAAPFVVGGVELYVDRERRGERLSRRRRVGRGAAQACGRRDVRGQGCGQGRLPAVPGERTRSRPRALPGRPPAPRGRARGARAALPAPGRPRSPAHRRRRGADPVERPRAGVDGTGRLPARSPSAPG